MSQQYPALLIGSSGSPPSMAVLASMLVILAIDVRLIFYCLDDLNQRAIVAGGDKRFWAAVIILGGPVGQIVYMLYGRGPY
jgi:hypothetical protein